MAQSYDFYKTRADEAAAEAAAATLDNRRDQALRAEKTWRGLADQAQKVEEDRAKASAARQERIAAEEAAASEG